MQDHSKPLVYRSAVVEYGQQSIRKHPAARILCVGDDATLLNSRQLILIKADYDVRSCTSDQAVQFCRLASFDVALICRSISDARSIMLTQALRAQFPHLMVIRLKPTSSPQANLYDLTVDTANGPESLLNDIERFLTQLR